MKRKQLLFLLALLMTAVTGAWAQDTYDPLTTEGVPPYCGTIYVATTGSDDNEGSENAPVATVGKAIELAFLTADAAGRYASGANAKDGDKRHFQSVKIFTYHVLFLYTGYKDNKIIPNIVFYKPKSMFIKHFCLHFMQLQCKMTQLIAISLHGNG